MNSVTSYRNHLNSLIEEVDALEKTQNNKTMEENNGRYLDEIILSLLLKNLNLF